MDPQDCPPLSSTPLNTRDAQATVRGGTGTVSDVGRRMSDLLTSEDQGSVFSDQWPLRDRYIPLAQRNEWMSATHPEMLDLGAQIYLNNQVVMAHELDNIHVMLATIASGAIATIANSRAGSKKSSPSRVEDEASVESKFDRFKREIVDFLATYDQRGHALVVKGAGVNKAPSAFLEFVIAETSGQSEDVAGEDAEKEKLPVIKMLERLDIKDLKKIFALGVTAYGLQANNNGDDDIALDEARKQCAKIGSVPVAAKQGAGVDPSRPDRGAKRKRCADSSYTDA